MPTMIYTRADGVAELTPIRVSGVTIPCPSSWDPTEADLVKNSERNAAGRLVTDRVRANVKKFDLKWNFMLPEDFAAFRALLSANMFFQVEYIDADGTLKSAEMYKSDLTYSVSRILATGEIQGYKGVSVNLIER